MTPQELFDSNQKLVYGVYHKHVAFIESYRNRKDDICQEGLMALWKAANKYKPDSGTKFVTYAYRSILNNMYMYIRKNNKYNNEGISLSQAVSFESDSELIDMIEDKSDKFLKSEIEYNIKKILESESSRNKTIYNMRKNGYSQREISNKYCTSQPQVSRIIKKINNKIKAELV